MTLYEINSAIDEIIANATDPETGELVPGLEDELDKLNMEKEQKIENTVLYRKNLNAELNAITIERKALETREKSLSSKIERLDAYIMYALGDEPFKTARCVVKHNRSEKTVVNQEDKPKLIAWLEYFHHDWLRRKDPEPNLVEIKKAIKGGEQIPYAKLEPTHSITI